MRLIVDIESFDGFQKRIWMTAHEALQIGRSSQADVCIEDRELAEFHFAIEGTPEGWNLQAARNARVGVNGALVQRHRLRDGDTIIAGQTEFRVAIEGQPREAEARVATSAPLVPSTTAQPATFTHAQCNSGVSQLAITLNDTPAMEVLKKIAGQSAVYMAFNQQRFGGPLPALRMITEDLFAEAPEEIRVTDSLVVAAGPDGAECLSAFMRAAKADAAILFTSSSPLDQLLSEQKIGWAWYARPSILKQQLSLGSKELAKKLLASIELAILTEAQSDNLIVLARADVLEALLQRLSN